MASLAETLSETTVQPESGSRRQRGERGIRSGKMRSGKTKSGKTRPGETKSAVLLPWLRAQSINVTRHAAALRPFRREEFGTDAAAPSKGHIQVVNQLISTLRRGLLKMSEKVTTSIDKASEEPSSANLQRVVIGKDKAKK